MIDYREIILRITGRERGNTPWVLAKASTLEIILVADELGVLARMGMTSADAEAMDDRYVRGTLMLGIGLALGDGTWLAETPCVPWSDLQELKEPVKH